MSKTLTEMAGKALADAMSVQRCDDDLIHAVERIAEVVRAIAAKLEGEQPAPDVLGRVLELADARINELRSKRLATAKEESYGLAHDYTCMAGALAELSLEIRKEFNRD